VWGYTCNDKEEKKENWKKEVKIEKGNKSDKTEKRKKKYMLFPLLTFYPSPSPLINQTKTIQSGDQN